MLNLILAFIAGGLVVFIGMGIACRRLARRGKAEDLKRFEAQQEWEAAVGRTPPTSWRGQKGENRDPEIS